ncbi:MAG: putative DNA modification/repair radical SAM protein [Eubacteriales bacterium]|nr:putative DNA modification/repair radical SAM protein [Eubacteriales bacterium]
MELFDKVRILAAAAKYDVSCSSSGSTRSNKAGGIGNANAAGICHSWSADGRCISLLKILMTNVCAYDCVYCINRVTSDVERATLSPEELADLTINFYRRNYIEGLFLSSAVFGTPDLTTERMIKALELLRNQYNFSGYIHVKVIPGTDPKLLTRIGLLADRVSVNVELPSREGLQLLAPQKKVESILKPMGFIHQQIQEAREDRLVSEHKTAFVPAGQTTQLIIGATPDRDLKILKLSESLYKNYKLKRVYFSSYVPVVSHPNLPSLFTSPPLLREHRLYQADWLLRFYGFSANEILDSSHPDLSLDFDPKTEWALRHLDQFPVEINQASFEILIRVPGLGVTSAQRIIAARRAAAIDFELLKKIGVVIKRARYFITCKGRFAGVTDFDPTRIRQNMLADGPDTKGYRENDRQLSLFAPIPLGITSC